MQRSKIRTIFDNMLGGATFNLADEATSAIAAPAVALMTDMDVIDAYRAGQELSKQNAVYDDKNSPYIKLGSEIAGGFINPLTYAGIGAAQKGGSAVNNIVRALGLGGAQGAAYGLGSGDGLYDRLYSAAQGGAIGAAAGGALQGVGEVAKNPRVQKFVKDYIADESGALNIRFTNNPDSPLNDVDYAMYKRTSNPEDVSHFGRYGYEIDDKDLPDISDIENDVINQFIKDKRSGLLYEYDKDLGRYKLKDIKKFLDPDNIVDSAGVWDDPSFVSWMYDRVIYNYPSQKRIGYKTQNGSILFENEGAKKVYDKKIAPNWWDYRISDD